MAATKIRVPEEGISYFLVDLGKLVEGDRGAVQRWHLLASSPRDYYSRLLEVCN